MYNLNRIVSICFVLSLYVNNSLAHETTYPQYLMSLAQNEPISLQKIEKDFCLLNLELIDSDTKETLPGNIRIIVNDIPLIEIPPLLNRGTGLNQTHKTREWHVLLHPTQVQVPKKRISIEAFSGLETEVTSINLDLTNKDKASIQIPLRRFYSASEQNLVAGNTHLHLRRLSLEQADHYLESIPLADGLDLTFVSYLSRHEDDKSYISNMYTKESLKSLSNPQNLLGWGEELRHNFGPYDEGYGHVMLLNIPELIQPVSIGPGIMDDNQTDDMPVREGIQKARESNGTVIWCHNAFGFEDVPNWLDGLLDAQNIFDQGTKGSYEDTFYRYLNLGLKIPFSTGTDWFIFDFSRVYVHIDKPTTAESWLQALANGKSYITNSTFLEFQVDGHRSGESIQLSNPKQVNISGKGIGRHDFENLELIYNGKVVHTLPSQLKNKHFHSQFNHILWIDEPGWLALRINSNVKNEYGQKLFAHTSPVYIEINNQKIQKEEALNALISDMEESIQIIKQKGVFSTEIEKQEILKIYTNQIESLQKTND